MADEKLNRDWLRRIELGPHGRLPSERDLADELGVSRATLRKELDGLERDGRLSRHVGRGTFLIGAPPPRIRGDEGQADRHETVAPRDVYGARLLLEPDLAARAALHGTGRHFARIEEEHARVARAADWEAWDDAESGFRRSVAEAAGNPLLTGLLAEIEAARATIAWGEFRSQRPPLPGPGDPEVAGAAAVTRAILRRDAAGARESSRSWILEAAARSLGAALGL